MSVKILKTVFCFTSLAVASAVFFFGKPFFHPPLQSRTSVVDHGPTIVRQIRALSRLETVSFTEQKLLEGRKEWKAVPQWLAGDRLQFMAHGEVVAGVDLSRFGPSNIRWQEERAIVKLPTPQVFHRTTGWLNGKDAQLETQVRQRADDVLLAGALQEGILDQARWNAEKAIRELLNGFGIKQVTFV